MGAAASPDYLDIARKAIDMQIPLPSGIDAAQRRFREIQSAIDTTGSRTLESASINQGNLRVRHGGNIIIGDGGSLHITGGDLIIGKGKIQGNALAQQFDCQLFSIPLEENAPTPSTQWRMIKSVTVTPPAWSEKTLVVGSWYAYQIYGMGINEGYYFSKARLAAGSQRALERRLAWEYALEIGVNSRSKYSAAGVGIFELTGNQVFNLGIEGWASRGKASMPVQLDALCLFTRNNS